MTMNWIFYEILVSDLTPVTEHCALIYIGSVFYIVRLMYECVRGFAYVSVCVEEGSKPERDITRRDQANQSTSEECRKIIDSL